MAEINQDSYCCGDCRYRDCSTTVWPCKVCIRVHQYKDYFVPNEETERKLKGEVK